MVHGYKRSVNNCDVQADTRSIAKRNVAKHGKKTELFPKETRFTLLSNAHKQNIRCEYKNIKKNKNIICDS